MKKNIKKIQVTFSRVYNTTPTFMELFHSRIPKPTIGETYEISVNHVHYHKICQMASSFGYSVNEIKA